MNWKVIPQEKTWEVNSKSIGNDFVTTSGRLDLESPSPLLAVKNSLESMKSGTLVFVYPILRKGFFRNFDSSLKGQYLNANRLDVVIFSGELEHSDFYVERITAFDENHRVSSLVDLKDSVGIHMLKAHTSSNKRVRYLSSLGNDFEKEYVLSQDEELLLNLRPSLQNLAEQEASFDLALWNSGLASKLLGK